MEWSWYHTDPRIVREEEQCLCGASGHRWSPEQADEWRMLDIEDHYIIRTLHSNTSFDELHTMNQRRSEIYRRCEELRRFARCPLDDFSQYMTDFPTFPFKHGDIYCKKNGSMHLIEQIGICRGEWHVHSLDQVPQHMVTDNIYVWTNVACSLGTREMHVGESSKRENMRYEEKRQYQAKTFEFVLLLLLRLGLYRDLRIKIAQLVFYPRIFNAP